jgi:transposase-like protein
MATKIRPQDKIRVRLADALAGAETTKDVVEILMVNGFQDIVQRGLEAEVSECLGVEWHQHSTKEHPRRGHRNGYNRRRIKTRLGRVLVEAPRVRGSQVPFHSKIMNWVKAKQSALITLVIESYVRGLSTRDIEAVFTDPDGRPLLSRGSVSTITDDLAAEYEAFSRRRLDDLDVVYMFVDGVYESIRDYMNNQSLLAAWAICADGHKELLHIAAVESESEEAWTGFFDDMKRRGLRHPLLVISDGGKGAHAAITRAFPHSDRQRCIAHKLRNLMAKLPKLVKDIIHKELIAIYYAPDRPTADVLAQQFLARHSRSYPAMMACFMDDLEACLVHLKYPLGHRKYIRTTNLLERTFEEQKRRTKVIPTFPGERSVIKLVYAVLIRTSNNWNKVSMTPLELEQLKALRHIKSNNDHRISFLVAA